MRGAPLLVALAALLLPTAAPAAGDGARTLEAITIEGEAALPRLTFVESREPFRLPAPTAPRWLPAPLVLVAAATLPGEPRPVMGPVPENSTPDGDPQP